MKELKDLKEGDKVMVGTLHGEYLSKVERITPKGFLVVEGKLFNTNGCERTTDKWNFSCISVASDEEIKSFERAKQVRRYKKVVSAWLQLDVVNQLEKLQEIYKIIKGDL